MSRRYGRNQKRKHREEIARLRREMEAEVKENRRAILKYAEALAAQRREMEGLVEEIRAVCKDSALLPAREVALPGEGPWRMALQEPIRIRSRLFNDSLVEPMMISTVDIYEVRAFLEEHLDTFRKIVHVKLPDREVRLAVSREAMAAFGRHGLRQVAENLFSMLLGALQEEPHGR